MKSLLGAGFTLVLLALAGCTTPISADRVSLHRSYTQTTASALSGNQYSSRTRLVLHRYDLEKRFEKAPAETLRILHEKTRGDNRRDLLFALAELNYLHAGQVAHEVKPWAPKNARDYYLASALYAYFYLFDPGHGGAPSPIDPHVSIAVGLYNRALAKGFISARDTNGTLTLASGVRQLPQGPVHVQLSQPGFPWSLAEFERFLPADDFFVRGLTVRNRQAGLGAPLIGLKKATASFPIVQRVPATIFLRVSGDLKTWREAPLAVSLELYSPYNQTRIEVEGQELPLETDTTVPIAHTLNDSFVWKIGSQQFFSSEEKVKSAIYPTQPYAPGRVPVVFVHGTFSSPIWWAEMLNTLRADPVLSERCQFWNYIYNSGNPVTYSAANFRDALTNIVHQFDPEGKDPALQRMVVIGHSQGGLLAKMTVTDSGDQLWRAVTQRNLDDVKLSPEQRALVERNLWLKPVPSVTRVVFISTPHRGSYRATSLVRRLSAMFVSLPNRLMNSREEFLRLREELRLPAQVRRSIPTSLDSMSPQNPVLLTLAEIPPTAGVKAHSIIPVKGGGDPTHGKDGVVTYRSAHVTYVESELVVRGGHSCQDQPATIEEVRRILLEHLNSL